MAKKTPWAPGAPIQVNLSIDTETLASLLALAGFTGSSLAREFLRDFVSFDEAQARRSLKATVREQLGPEKLGVIASLMEAD